MTKNITKISPTLFETCNDIISNVNSKSIKTIKITSLLCKLYMFVIKIGFEYTILSDEYTIGTAEFHYCTITLLNNMLINCVPSVNVGERVYHKFLLRKGCNV